MKRFTFHTNNPQFSNGNPSDAQTAKNTSVRSSQTFLPAAKRRKISRTHHGELKFRHYIPTGSSVSLVSKSERGTTGDIPTTTKEATFQWHNFSFKHNQTNTSALHSLQEEMKLAQNAMQGEIHVAGKYQLHSFSETASVSVPQLTYKRIYSFYGLNNCTRKEPRIIPLFHSRVFTGAWKTRKQLKFLIQRCVAMIQIVYEAQSTSSFDSCELLCLRGDSSGRIEQQKSLALVNSDDFQCIHAENGHRLWELRLNRKISLCSGRPENLKHIWLRCVIKNKEQEPVAQFESKKFLVCSKPDASGAYERDSLPQRITFSQYQFQQRKQKRDEAKLSFRSRDMDSMESTGDTVTTTKRSPNQSQVPTFQSATSIVSGSSNEQHHLLARAGGLPFSQQLNHSAVNYCATMWQYWQGNCSRSGPMYCDVSGYTQGAAQTMVQHEQASHSRATRLPSISDMLRGTK